MGKWMDLFETSKPYIGMTWLQFGYAGMDIITKVALNQGMSHFVLVVYRHAVATVVLAPFAFFLERKVMPRITFIMFCQIFALGLLGPVLDQNLYYLGLKYTSPTFAGAMTNLVPAITFVMALLFRMEKVKIRELRSQAKIVGTIVCVGGAMVMTFYKGHILPSFWSSQQTSSHAVSSSTHDSRWIKGAMFLAASTLAWGGLFVLQASVVKKFSAQLSLTTLICLMGTLQSAAVTLALERRPSAWAIGLDMKLVAAVYSGIVGSGIAYYVQGLCMEIKGPVFATAFSPLEMIIVAIMDSIIFARRIFMGMILGGIFIVLGLYGVLWGKAGNDTENSSTSSEMLPVSLHKFENDMQAYTSSEAIPPNPDTILLDIKNHALGK
ncbi:hypothetical protein SUGI_1137800 [Cryptomeria japonica]|uniref:WAT1-related protein At5g07050 n=1 Tax=Cryptomeria japonica TaxID=3369 RepID=UPI002414C554|nr:WAT1-related protein At5g07050 [Cryptomeria japonica]GLJ53365.1 hypothetical protein SUGI_1137800 [Cryptomeria japonica]